MEGLDRGDGVTAGHDAPRPRTRPSALHMARANGKRSLVAVAGGGLIGLGVVLVVLPGPFTLPLIVAGLAVLATEFPWAARARDRVRSGTGRLVDLARRERRGPAGGR